MTVADVHRLVALGLLEAEGIPKGTPSLGALCAAGLLEGGLSVAADVRPDELLGPLCQRIGAERLRVLDARTAPPELQVRLGEREERWPVPDVQALVSALNRSYRAAPKVRAVATLGDFDDARQLWCIPKSALAALLREGLLKEAENLAELRGLAAD